MVVLFMPIFNIKQNDYHCAAYYYVTQVLPIIFPLKWFYSEIAYHTKYFGLFYSIDVVSTFSYCRKSIKIIPQIILIGVLVTLGGVVREPFY